jgi:MFS family permease
VLIFEVGSAVIGSAQSIQAVIVGRAIAGFGGSGIYVGTINIISSITTTAERAQYLNFVGMSWSLGTVLGPIVGGAFADSEATWRWAFYINICIAALSVPICIWLVPPISATVQYNLQERIKRIDYLGAILFMGGVVSVVMVLGFGGADYEWKSGQMIGLYVATVVLWTTFCLQQRLRLLTVDRIFPAQFACNWEMVNLFSWTAIAIANVVVTIYSLPLFFQFTYGHSALRSAVYTLPFIFSAVTSAGAGGPLFSQYPRYMPWFAGCSALMLIGNGLLSTIDYNTSIGAICGYTVIQGIGVGPVIQLGYTVGQTKVARSMVPQVTAFLTCAQMAGLALSLGIATSVFLNRATDDIAAILPGTTRDFIQASINGARTELLQNISPEDRLHVLQAVARNVGRVFYMNVAGASLGFVTSLIMRRERLTL